MGYSSISIKRVLPADLLGDIMHLHFFLQMLAMEKSEKIERGEAGMAILRRRTSSVDALPRRRRSRR